MLSSVKRLIVTMVIFSSIFSRVMFLMSAQIVRLKWCKVAKIAFPRYLSRVISSLNTYVLLETMINQIGFICAKFLQIRFANVTPFDRPEEMHCITVHSRMLYIYTTKLFSYFREKMHCMYLVVLYLFQINVLRHNFVGGCCNLVLSWNQGRSRVPLIAQS